MANPIFFADYCSATLAASANTSTTTLVLTDPDEPFPPIVTPGNYWYLTLIDQPSFAINLAPPAQREIVKVTAQVDNLDGTWTITCVRGITTTPQQWAVGSVCQARSCAQALLDLKDTGGLPVIGFAPGVAGVGPANFTVKDGSTTVFPVNTVNFTSGATVTDAGGGEADVAVSGGAGGSSQAIEYTVPGSYTFNVPAGIEVIEASFIGAGGGGAGRANSSTTGAGGGGSGEVVVRLPIFVTPLGTVAVVVGAGGAGGTSGSNSGVNGALSSVGAFIALGGRGGVGSNESGGAGGGPNGGAGGISGANQTQVTGSAESPVHFGGSGGGGGGTMGLVGGTGAGAGGFSFGGAGGAVVATHAGGGGGAASIYGVGGTAGDGDAAGVSAASTAYGAAGGGAGANTAQSGGAGAGGYVLLTWVG